LFIFQAKHVQEDVGDVTLLINNAGVVMGLTATDLSSDDIKHCLKVNTLAHFWVKIEVSPACNTMLF